MRRLDELPLAVELAAARTTLFTPEQLLERLGQRLDLLKGGRDADPRQQTLRAAIEWSHELLTEQEQRLFRRLSVFAGGCSYEAAEQVCDADPDTLQSLLEKSLVRRRDTEPGRATGCSRPCVSTPSSRLDGSLDGTALTQRHAEFFRLFAREKGARHAVRLHPDELEAEFGNFRVALATLMHDDVDAALALAVPPLGRFCYRRGYLREGTLRSRKRSRQRLGSLERQVRWAQIRRVPRHARGRLGARGHGMRGYPSTSAVATAALVESQTR